MRRRANGEKTILALVLAAGLTSFVGNAEAGLYFSWSFAGVNNGVGGAVAGFLALNNEGTQADSVYITSAPFAYNPALNFATLNFANSFSVSASGLIQDANLGFNDDFSQGLLSNSNGRNYVNLSGNTLDDNDGMAGITFTLYTGTAAVPEPSQVAASILLIGGIAGFVMVKRRKTLVA